MLWIGKTKAAGKGNDGLAQRRVSKFICHKVQVYWRHPAQIKPFYRVHGGGSSFLLLVVTLKSMNVSKTAGGGLRTRQYPKSQSSSG